MTDELNKLWGNPASKGFRKQRIRQVAIGGTVTLVNKLILDATANLLKAATGPLPPVLEGWQPLEGDEPDPSNYGLCVRNHESLEQGNGFILVGDWLVYSGDPQESTSDYMEAGARSVLEQLSQETKTDHPSWSTAKPGEREAALDDAGSDIMVFQLVFNTTEQMGRLNQADVDLIRMLQARWGIEVTGTLTRDLWRMILPTYRTFMLEYGDAGTYVKVLQAILIAYDWADELGVSGRFDQATARALGNLQDTYGLRVAPRTGAPEWTALLGKWPLD